MDDLFRDKGYVQILDSDGRTRYFEEVSGLELGKYFKALTDRNVNTGVLGVDSGAGNKVGHSIRKDQIVRLEKEHKSGDAVWAEIGYTNQ